MVGCSQHSLPQLLIKSRGSLHKQDMKRMHTRAVIDSEPKTRLEEELELIIRELDLDGEIQNKA